jgi:excisionase family DNA binding protein
MRDDADDRQRRPPGADDAYTTPGRLASYWGVHVDTIYRDVKKGALRAYRLPGGQLRIRLSDARKYGRPIE